MVSIKYEKHQQILKQLDHDEELNSYSGNCQRMLSHENRLHEDCKPNSIRYNNHNYKYSMCRTPIKLDKILHRWNINKRSMGRWQNLLWKRTRSVQERSIRSHTVPKIPKSGGISIRRTVFQTEVFDILKVTTIKKLF